MVFPCYVKELSIHVHCVCLAESVNKWVERMAVRGGRRPFVKLLIQLVREILHLSGKSQGISNTYGCGNHGLMSFMYNISYTKQ